ncbi:hypothetical protein R1sor_004757 [Riccia sorocarpa]|uniref:F-box associated domain-containing protein n=1 Tax=Riccia sorocarpa TaxID=122646 RepID=A0ABD3HLX0_9MARC
MLWGLIMDHKTGNYKVVIGYFSKRLTNKTFIYDSALNLWSISAAASPVWVPNFLDKPRAVRVQSCICSGGELIWLLYEMNYVVGGDVAFMWLVKYNMERDEWSTATQQSPIPCCERVHLVHHVGENRPFIVSLVDIDDYRDGHVPGDGIWWLVLPTISPIRRYPCVDIFALSTNPPKVIRFPEFYDHEIRRLVTFVAILKAFV